VLGIERLLRLRRVAHLHAAILAEAHHRGEEWPAERVGQHRRRGAAHRGDQRVGGAEVDADREPLLVRRRRHAGFGDLKQRHYSISSYATSISPSSRSRNMSFLTSSAAPV